jgi:hypothetical protein
LISIIKGGLLLAAINSQLTAFLLMGLQDRQRNKMKSNEISFTFFTFMSDILNLHQHDPFADVVFSLLNQGDGDDLKVDGYIHVRVQQRNGRKTLTTVQVQNFSQKVL